MKIDSFKKTKLVVLLFFLILTFLIFGNSIFNDFTFDDIAIVQNRTEIRNLDNLWKFFFSPYSYNDPTCGAYRPAVFIGLSLNYAIFGDNPWGFHLINVFFHAFTSWIIFLLLQRLTRKDDFSLLVSLLFLVTPIHTEAINGIVGRAEIQSLLFLSGSLLVLLSPKKNTKKISKYFWAALLFIFALMSKETALGLLPLYGIILWLNNKGNNFISRLQTIIKKHWQEFIYLLSATVIYFTLRALTLGPHILGNKATIVENPLKFIDWHERILNAFKILGMYLVKIIWPYNNLSSDYSYNQISTHINWLNPLLWVGLFTLMGLTAILIITMIKPPKKSSNYKILILAASFFLFFYLPISNIIFPIGTIMAERLMYIPSLGICMMLGLLIIMLRSLLRNKTNNKNYSQYIFLSIVILLTIFYSTVSFNRNFDWKNEASLFASAATRSPNSVLSRSNLGAIYLLEDNLPAAEKEIMAAQNIYDSYNHNLNNLGLLYLKQGQIEKAKNQFIYTLKKYPSYGPSIDNLALAYFKLGEYQKAKKFWSIIHGNENAQIYLMAYFNDEFNKLIQGEKIDQAEKLLERIKNIVDNKKWLKEIGALLK